jgi:large subunit ribosomal protein L18
MSNKKVEKRIVRHKRIRAKISGTATRPRFAVFKSNSNLIAQLIDDEKGNTLAYSWSKNKKAKTLKEKAEIMGKEIAEAAKSQNITQAVFDRGGFIYTGNIKAIAESARANGLEF